MFDMEYYIREALKKEDNFRSQVRNSRPLRRPPPKLQPASEIRTLSPAFLFPENETVSVKIHQTKAMGFPGDPPNPFLHRHDFFEFNYVWRGQVKNTLSDTVMFQGPEQLLLMNPLAVHDPQPATDDAVLFNILLDRRWGETVLANLLTFNEKYFHFFIDQLYSVERNPSYLLFECTQELTNLVQQIIQEYYDHRPCYQQMLMARLIELFVQCTRQSYKAHKQAEKHQQQSKRTSDILAYLRTHYATATLSGTANYFSYSTGYLSRMIKQETGQNFCDIMRTLKLKNACNFLTYSSLSIEMITEHIGYKDAAHFSKAFTKCYGCTPSQYRREHQQTEAE